MKFLKLGLIAILMSLVVMSCSDDIVNEDGIGGTDNLPDTKITMVTTVEGATVDTKEITKTKEDKTYVPSSYSLSGALSKQLKTITITISNLLDGNTFSVSSVFTGEEVTEGTYDEISNTPFIYRNSDLFEMPYTATSGKMTLTKVQEISLDGRGSYYCEGEMEVTYVNAQATPTSIVVKTTFEGLPILFNGF